MSETGCLDGAEGRSSMLNEMVSWAPASGTGTATAA